MESRWVTCIDFPSGIEQEVAKMCSPKRLCESSEDVIQMTAEVCDCVILCCIMTIKYIMYVQGPVVTKRGHGGCGKHQPHYRLSQEAVCSRIHVYLLRCLCCIDYADVFTSAFSSWPSSRRQGHRMEIIAEWKIVDDENQDKKACSSTLLFFSTSQQSM